MSQTFPGTFHAETFNKYPLCMPGVIYWDVFDIAGHLYVKLCILVTLLFFSVISWGSCSDFSIIKHIVSSVYVKKCIFVLSVCVFFFDVVWGRWDWRLRIPSGCNTMIHLMFFLSLLLRRRHDIRDEMEDTRWVRSRDV